MQSIKSILCHILFLVQITSTLWACSTSGATAPDTEAGVDPATSPASTSPTILSDVKDYIRELVDSAYTPGIVVALITSEGVAYHSYGKMAINGGPVDEHTIFEIGSTTKAITAILLSAMVEEGTVAFDDPVQRYLPPDVTMPGGDSITLEHLATHLSGLPRDVFAVTEIDAYSGYTCEQLYDFLSSYTLTRDPGTQYEYSDTATGLLGHVLSLVAGMSYEELLIDRLGKPLGMEDLRVTLSEEQRSRFATGYRSDGEVAVNLDFGCLASCGGLRSTAADGARLIQANLGLYETDLYPALQRTQEPRAETGVEGRRVGLGWHFSMISGVEIVWHNGGTAGYHSYFGFDPSRKVGAVVLSNSSFSIDPIGEHMVFSQSELPAIRKTVPVAREVLEGYVGTYQLMATVIIEVVLKDDILMAGVTGLPNLPPMKIPVYAESEVDFFSKDYVDAQVTFEKDDTGRVVALVFKIGSMEQRAEKID